MAPIPYCFSISRYVHLFRHGLAKVSERPSQQSYAGGTRPWNRKNGAQDMNDGLLEVVAIDNLDLAILHAGGSGASVCQCRTAVITTKKPVPMQVDGEPCLMQPCSIRISMEPNSAKVAKMLARNKNATCRPFSSFNRLAAVLKHFYPFFRCCEG
jgi:hypothetical protein